MNFDALKLTMITEQAEDLTQRRKAAKSNGSVTRWDRLKAVHQTRE